MPEQSPQPDQAAPGQPLAPATQDPSATPPTDAAGNQAKAETLGRYIEDLEARIAAIPIPDDPIGEAGQKYDALVAWYKKHVSGARARLMGIRR